MDFRLSPRLLLSLTRPRPGVVIYCEDIEVFGLGFDVPVRLVTDILGLALLCMGS